MDVKGFYSAVNGSYENALAIMMNDALIERMLAKFMANNCSQAIIDAYNQKDYQAVFANAHSLKGVVGNLALTPLFEIASIITEATRNGATPNIDNEINTLKERYLLIEENFRKFGN